METMPISNDQGLSAAYIRGIGEYRLTPGGCTSALKEKALDERKCNAALGL